MSFSECGDRAIALDHMRPFRRMRPGRCADLPPMAKPDRVLGQCRECAGAYEGMPVVIDSRARIARPNEPGEPLVLTGRALGPDGRPRKGVIVYAYQADHFGIYPQADPPRSDASQYQGALRGWARTDDHGRYTFDTIRPGIEGDNPQHIHMLVIEPGCATYYIDEINFTDDPVYQQLPEARRRNKDHHWGGTGIVTPARQGQVWKATRDIHLGENIRDYTECSAGKSP
jgi:protocatechuate 3,4-dioxygenase beta subunit